jgi:Flp pilus assembly pilin Flp
VINNLRRSLRRLHGPRDTGAVAIEFALLMAFMPLTVLAFGIVDYGEVMAQATNLTAIIRGAAEYARGQVVQGNPLPTAANLNTLLGVPAAVFSPPPSSFCTCADNTSVTCPRAGAVNPCAGRAGRTDTRVLTYVAVSGSLMSRSVGRRLTRRLYPEPGPFRRRLMQGRCSAPNDD